MPTSYSELDLLDQTELEGEVRILYQENGLAKICDHRYVGSVGGDSCVQVFLKGKSCTLAGHLTLEELRNGAFTEGIEKMVDNYVERLEGYVVDGFTDHEKTEQHWDNSVSKAPLEIDFTEVEVGSPVEADVVVDRDEWDIYRLDASEGTIEQERTRGG
jgi:hypothetical protein